MEHLFRNVGLIAMQITTDMTDTRCANPSLKFWAFLSNTLYQTAKMIQMPMVSVSSTLYILAIRTIDERDLVIRPYDCHLSTKALKDLGISVFAMSFNDWWYVIRKFLPKVPSVMAIIVEP